MGPVLNMNPWVVLAEVQVYVEAHVKAHVKGHAEAHAEVYMLKCMLKHMVQALDEAHVEEVYSTFVVDMEVGIHIRVKHTFLHVNIHGNN